MSIAAWQIVILIFSLNLQCNTGQNNAPVRNAGNEAVLTGKTSLNLTSGVLINNNSNEIINYSIF